MFRKWLIAQGNYTRGVLGRIAPRAAYASAFHAMVGGLSTVIGYEQRGARAFLLVQRAGAQTPVLEVREAGRTRILFDPAQGAAPGELRSIAFFVPSPDGSKTIVGLAVDGGVSTTAIVLDVDSGRAIGARLPRADPGYAAWSPDGRGVFVSQLREPVAGAPSSEAYLNIGVVWSDLIHAPRRIVGTSLSRGPGVTPIDIPSVEIAPASGTALAVVRSGVAREVSVWTVPAGKAADPTAHWSRLTTPADAVVGWATRGSWVYLLSQKNAPNGQVLRVRAGAPLSSADLVLPQADTRVLETIAGAADGVYASALEGAYSGLVRVDDAGGLARVALPFRGAIRQLTTDPRLPGAIVRLESWVRPPTIFQVVPGGPARILAAPQGMLPATAKYTILDLSASAHDGVRVPLSVVGVSGRTHPGPFLLSAYGSYGFAQRASYNERTPLLLDAGARVGLCHVRGGGELGAAWRFAGKDALKTNSWKDLIACAQTLIDRHITTRDQLVIRGVSAGGITVGRAMTERPDLFAAVVMGVPSAGMLRSEFQVNGPANVPEFGTVETEAGFRNLLAMDSYQSVRDGVQYPAVLLTTGLNDAFVDPWQPGKMAARLQESGTRAPVLLRVEDRGGHAGGPTVDQRAQEEADIAAFLFWRAGEAAWQPAP